MVLANAKAVVLLAAVSDVLAAASLLLIQAGAALHCFKALKKQIHHTALTFPL